MIYLVDWIINFNKDILLKNFNSQIMAISASFKIDFNLIIILGTIIIILIVIAKRQDTLNK